MSLYLKLTLAFIILAITTAALIAVFIRATSADRLFRFVEEQQRTSMEDRFTITPPINPGMASPGSGLITQSLRPKMTGNAG